MQSKIYKCSKQLGFLSLQRVLSLLYHLSVIKWVVIHMCLKHWSIFSSNVYCCPHMKKLTFGLYPFEIVISRNINEFVVAISLYVVAIKSYLEQTILFVCYQKELIHSRICIKHVYIHIYIVIEYSIQSIYILVYFHMV